MENAVHPVTVLHEVEARIPRGERGVVIAGFGGVLLLAGLVLAVACANVGNLTLARVSARRAEMAVRLAMGAGRRHIIGLVVTESVLLAAIAGVLAVVLASSAFGWLEVRATVLGLPPGIQVGIDARVAAFAALATLTTTLVFGLVPAWQVTRANVQASLQSTAPTSAGGRNRLRRVFLTAQVAGSVTFAMLAILFTRSVSAIHDVDLGYAPDAVAVVSMDGGPDDGAARMTRLRQRLDASLAAEPGIVGYAFATSVPMSGYRMRVNLDSIEGVHAADTERFPVMATRVSPGYFSVVGMPLVAGRDFAPADGDGAPPVAIVNQAFVDRYWPNQSALGRRLGDSTVIGVVANARLESLAGAPSPHLFQPLSQNEHWRNVLHARTAGDAVALAQRLQRAISSLDPTVLTEARTMRQAMSNADLLPRVMQWAFSAAGLLATALAATGLYGVMSYLVGLRRREFGIRAALGASPTAIVSQVMIEGVGLLLAGLAIGVVLAVATATILQAQLVGVAPIDPVAMLAALALLSVAALLASVVPAHQAARVDPVRARRACPFEGPRGAVPGSTIAQRRHRVDASRPAGRHVAGRDRGSQQRRAGRRRRAGRARRRRRAGFAGSG